jgi:hypothetical protein
LQNGAETSAGMLATVNPKPGSTAFWLCKRHVALDFGQMF